MKLCVDNVKPGATKRDVGHVWLGLIHYYFRLNDNFSGEERMEYEYSEYPFLQSISQWTHNAVNNHSPTITYFPSYSPSTPSIANSASLTQTHHPCILSDKSGKPSPPSPPIFPSTFTNADFPETLTLEICHSPSGEPTCPSSRQFSLCGMGGIAKSRFSGM